MPCRFLAKIGSHDSNTLPRYCNEPNEKTPRPGVAIQKRVASNYKRLTSPRKNSAVVGHLNSKVRCRIRRGFAPVRLEDCQAVLVTSNAALARVAYEFGKEHECSREVSTVITNYSLANIAWLKAPLGAPGLPERELLATCYAAMEPGDALWKKYLEEIDRLKASGKVSANDHEALRYSLRASDELMNLTLGEEEALSERTVTQILEQVKGEYVAEQSEAVAAEKQAHAVTRRDKDILLEQQEATMKRLYWLADGVSKWSARSVFVLAAIVLLGASLASPFLISDYVIGSYLATALLHLLLGVGVLYGLMNWYFSISLSAVATSIENWTRPRIYRRLLSFFSLGQTMDELAEFRGHNTDFS